MQKSQLYLLTYWLRFLYNDFRYLIINFNPGSKFENLNTIYDRS